MQRESSEAPNHSQYMELLGNLFLLESSLGILSNENEKIRKEQV
jgi:hypothetical protein